ncbi:MAG TPA: MBOAT family O-acyltransferase [Stellaceae bacterium]|jgi:D-alanyl-lipoteichoic acid acyltransferase DltB (MBOAT superfamily)
MVFTSLTFIAFAAMFFPLFFLSRGRLQTIVLLIGSYIFYGWWDWRFLGLLLTSTVVDYTLGRCIARSETEAVRRVWLTFSVTANLGFLGFFKYFNFFADSLTGVLRTFGMQADWATLHIVLPVGISFYTFQSMSYTIDVYRRRIEPERDFLTFASFIALFPQLVAGPIVRATTLLPQMHGTKRFRWVNLFVGLEMVVTGFFMKLVVADNLAPFVNHVFDLPEAYNSATLLTGSVFFAFQIYGDFAGYSLIAIGLGRVMGYRFCRNFRRPYFAASFSDFWTRWHISLSSWLRDYLYISLGGNRFGTYRTYRNLMTTMLLGGLWHGANWTFIVWGALHGFYLVMQRVLSAGMKKLGLGGAVASPVGYLISVFAVFTLTTVAWVFFRAENFTQAWIILERIVALGDFHLADLPLKFQVVKGVVLIALLLSVEAAAELRPVRASFRSTRWVRSAAVLAMLWAVSLVGSFSGEQFIYFQF